MHNVLLYALAGYLDRFLPKAKRVPFLSSPLLAGMDFDHDVAPQGSSQVRPANAGPVSYVTELAL